MKKPLVAAIDIGKSGGVAWQFEESIVCAKMPSSESEVLEMFTDLKIIHDLGVSDSRIVPVAFVEKVGGYIGNAHPGSRMFTFGEGFGFIKGILQASGWKVILVRPQDWMRKLGLFNSEKLPRGKWKNKLKDEATRLFPNLKPTLATSDALLILEYSRRIGLE